MYLSSQYSQSLASEDSCLISEKQRSSIFRLNEQPTYGIYNRNDYMARCYRGCWKWNARIGPELKKLLCFGGQSSTSGDYLSTLFFLLVLLSPLVSVISLFPSKSLTFETKTVISSVMLGICLILCVWHSYSIYVVVTNKDKWIKSWFTFNVAEKVLMPSTNQVASRFFDIRKHLKFYDVTRDSLTHFPLLNIHQKQTVYIKFNVENMNRARIILYTSHFLDSVNGFTLKIALCMLVLSIACSALSAYELVMLLLNGH